MISKRLVPVLAILIACGPMGFGRQPKPRVAKAVCALPSHAPANFFGRPLAMVEGQPIYEKDLTGSEAAQLLRLHEEEYKLERSALHDAIRQKLVEAEAKKEGVTVEQLYQRDVDAKIPAPTEAEARGYYDAVHNQATPPFARVRSQIVRYLKQSEIARARERYGDSLRARANVEIFLPPPTTPIASNDPARVKGNPKAPVTIAEFGDFECPFCGRVEPTLMDLLKKYNGQVNLAFHDFPLTTIHPFAEDAAEAGRCAEAQGEFWPMHDAMYADQSKLAVNDLESTAGKLGLNPVAFNACMKAGTYEAAIQQDAEEGHRAGVTGTPTFFINGRFLSGDVPELQFAKIIADELKAIKAGAPNVASR